MRILQIAPVIGPGTGVGAVAHHLESAWEAEGHDVSRFTLEDAHGAWIPVPGPGVTGKVALAARVIWFSTIGTHLARRRLRRSPGTVSICHNDALAGDVYVNHGILQAAMRARGRYVLRMLRNPMHLFIATRDTVRYSSAVHRVVVNLVDEEDVALRATYPRLRPRTVVIGNGVDVDGYRPPSAAERARARADLDLGDDAVGLLFVGHEYERKGLPKVLDALDLLPHRFHLVVVGGTDDMVDHLRTQVEARALASRVRLVGQVDDPLPAFRACDIFVFPSSYESYGLVVLEALACGMPVIATPVGCVPQVVTDGVNGFVVEPLAPRIAAAARELTGMDADQLATAARAAAEAHSWREVSRRYLDLFSSLGRAPLGEVQGPPPDRHGHRATQEPG
ncbi:glycosyltransferase family 4 protein [Cellulomonas sp. P24]|uniref:glycosyltransferase family 4 protein n=1 Tax=Cellulomonas sp. P24 TaxID=2885206 RepID=UPI00216B2CE3|nr:glycosyltransferase family 4 protein [Cellulomonas sp. P24]MCR6493758.1 glycosyltransferase family 4 protein [Cellulomonas sp. P24]